MEKYMVNTNQESPDIKSSVNSRNSGGLQSSQRLTKSQRNEKRLLQSLEDEAPVQLPTPLQRDLKAKVTSLAQLSALSNEMKTPSRSDLTSKPPQANMKISDSEKKPPSSHKLYSNAKFGNQSTKNSSGIISNKKSLQKKPATSAQKYYTIDASLNDDILQVFKEDELNIANKNKNQKLPQEEMSPIEKGHSEFGQNSFWKNEASKPLFNDDSLYRKMEKERKHKIEMNKAIQEQRNSMMNSLVEAKPSPERSTKFLPPDYAEKIRAHEDQVQTLREENDRLRQFLPDSYTEMRLRDRQLQERLSRYEQAIVDYENEKKALYETIQNKDKDIIFIKAKYEEANALWHQENLEKQKLEAVIEQQYRESMELDTFRRRAEDDKNHYRTKNIQFKTEIEQIIQENKKLTADKSSLHLRMSSLRAKNKQLEKKLDAKGMKSNKNMKVIMEPKQNQSDQWAEELEEKLSFTVEKFEEQNERFMECGRELAEATEQLEKQDVHIEELVEEKRALEIKLQAMVKENLGTAAKDFAGKPGADALSQKTGATKFTENEDALSNRNFNILANQERIAVDFLKQQNAEQLNKIQDLEEAQKANQINNKRLEEIQQNAMNKDNEINYLKQLLYENNGSRDMHESLKSKDQIEEEQAEKWVQEQLPELAAPEIVSAHSERAKRSSGRYQENFSEDTH